MIPMPSDTLSIALELLKAHPTWYLFPIRRLEKTPPLFKNELELASNDPKQIRKWAAQFNGPNWGIALKKSKLIVPDVDTKPGKQGQKSLDDLEFIYGELPLTLTVRTPSGGFHYYYNEANGATHQMRVNGFGKDIDSTNYVVAPGCWLSSGGSYEIVKNEPVADSPEWFGELLKPKDDSANVEQTPEVDLDQSANIRWAINYLKNDAPLCIQGSNGEWTLLLVAGELKDRGISRTKAVELLVEYYNVPEKCQPLWSVGEGPLADRLDVKVRNAWNYLKKNAPGSATAEAEFGRGEDKDTVAWVKADARRAWDAYNERQAEKRRKEDEQIAAREQAERDRRRVPSDDDFLPGEPAYDKGEQEPVGPDVPQGPMPMLSDIDDSEPVDGITDICKRWVWVTGIERFVNRADPTIQWKREQFDSEFNRFTDAASISKYLFKGDRIRRFRYLAFRPGMEEFQRWEYNVWRRGEIAPKQGNTDIWNEHLNYLFQDPQDRDHVLNWMAWILQNPMEKPNHALLIVGKQTGTGKSFLARALEAMVGKKNTQRPKNSSMGGDFNAWLRDCRLCIVEEVYQVGRRENLNAMRDLITEPTVEVNIKGVSAFKIENYACVMGVSNHPDALPLDENDRRWLVVETFALRRNPEYYQKLLAMLKDPEALSAIMYELMKRDLGKYSALSAAPVTEARNQMVELSRTDAETWLVDNASNAPLAWPIVAVRDVVDAMPPGLQRTTRLSTVVIPAFLKDKLRGVRLNVRRLSDGDRQRLWVLRGRISMIPDDQIVSTYEKARKDGAKALEQNSEVTGDFIE